MEEEFRAISIEPIVWQAEEFETHHRDTKWYIIFGLILALLVIYTIYTKQWILLAVVVVIGGVILLMGRLRPRTMQYQIDNQGVHINDKIFAFNQLKSFWVSEEGGRIALNLIATARFMPVIAIKITALERDRVKTALGSVLPEAGHKTGDWIDRINRFLRV